MDAKPEDSTTIHSDRFQNILQNFSKCKIDFINERDENKKIRETNTKLQAELKEIRELEKSNRYHLMSSREMIGNLQETVSQLVYLKRDVKKLKEEISLKDAVIAAAEKDKNNIIEKHNENVTEIRSGYEKQIEELQTSNERKIQQIQHESDIQIAQLACVIEEQRGKIKELEAEYRDKMNVVVLEYEEKIQRSAAQVSQLQEQLSRQAAHTDINMDAYRRRLEELEEKLKQSQFKQHLAQSSYPSHSQYESQVERPYSVDRDPYADALSVNLDPVLESSKRKLSATNQNRAPKAPNTLQVMFYDNKTTSGPKNSAMKGQFNITKKRKLYSDKDLHDF